MHLLLLILEQTVTILTFVSILIYAPFAKTWKRALVIPFAIAAVGSSISAFASAVFIENTPPEIFYVLAPIICAVCAAISRVIGYVIFQIPVFKRLEERVRAKLGCQKKLPPE
jgi:hypothetical protein